MNEFTNTPLLEADSLHKTYQMGAVNVPVLRGSSMQLHQGEWVTVLGSSGSGKSTLLHLLGGLDTPDPGCGEVRYMGKSISSHGRRSRNRYRNREVGFVFQFYHLLPELTVIENALLPGLVGSGIRTDRQRALELLEAFGLNHRLNHRPRELSGGERQRVAIARALVNRPKVLLADEPTGNLDEQTGQEILDLLRKEHQAGLSIVMVTHDQKIAALADRVVVLNRGQVEETVSQASSAFSH
ncbi:MAG: ABC transporter ATP-binding protein [Phycisphaerales bacterium]|nr:ABC transporter ATP-binding protein [Phycisphaerales bacterium]